MIPAFARRDGSFSAKRSGTRCAGAAGVDSRSGDGDAREAVEPGRPRRTTWSPASLSRGDKRRLELAMCLVQKPKLLLLDEPTAGMARADTNNTIDLLEEDRRQTGITLVVIEHDMHVVFSLAQKISVLAQGHGHRRGPAREDQGQSEGAGSLSRGGPPVSAALKLAENDMDNGGRTDTLLGSEQFQGVAPGMQPTTSKGGQHAYFSCWDIHAYYGESYIVQGVSFDIREGEIVALLGPQRRRQDLDAARHRPRRRPGSAPGRDLAGSQSAAHDEGARGELAGRESALSRRIGASSRA